MTDEASERAHAAFEQTVADGTVYLHAMGFSGPMQFAADLPFVTCRRCGAMVLLAHIDGMVNGAATPVDQHHISHLNEGRRP